MDRFFFCRPYLRFSNQNSTCRSTLDYSKLVCYRSLCFFESTFTTGPYILMSRDEKRGGTVHFAVLAGILAKKYHKNFLFVTLILDVAVTFDGLEDH
jgi:hypothetical protein